MKKRRIVVGDVHGCFNTLVELLEKKVEIGSNDKIYFLGDLIDRGPRIKETVDYAMDLCSKGLACVIRGNHEEMLLSSLGDPSNFEIWMYNGAEDTLASFGAQTPRDIGEEYINFFNSLPYYIEFEDFVLVHGDLNFKSENPFQDKYHMVWGRSQIVIPEKINYRKLVVGHTPTPLSKIISSLNTWKIYLDGGCVYARQSYYTELGYLCALDLDSMNLYYVYNLDF